MLGYLSYLSGELLGLSGIVTLFCCAVAISHYALHNISAPARVTLVRSCQTLSYVSEGAIFIYVGMDTLDPLKWKVGPYFLHTSHSTSAHAVTEPALLSVQLWRKEMLRHCLAVVRGAAPCTVALGPASDAAILCRWFDSYGPKSICCLSLDGEGSLTSRKLHACDILLPHTLLLQCLVIDFSLSLCRTPTLGRQCGCSACCSC